MIRPFTLVCMLMAGASGLYLYQSKHRAQMLDREIGRTISQTQQTRERIGMLKAEWALLNEPERLAELSKAHLGLRTLQPTQFAAAADLASRLPAAVAPSAPKPVMDPESEEAAPPAIAQAAPQLPKPVLARAVPEPRPAIEPKQAVAAAEPKTAPTRPARPAAPSAPILAAVATPVPAHHPAPAQVMSIAATSAATAPGTVGEAVLRAMRANSASYAPGPTPAPTLAPARPAPSAYMQSASAPVAATPIYATPAYATSAYAAQPAASLLGGSRGALPPPVPFATR